MSRTLDDTLRDLHHSADLAAIVGNDDVAHKVRLLSCAVRVVAYGGMTSLPVGSLLDSIPLYAVPLTVRRETRMILNV